MDVVFVDVVVVIKADNVICKMMIFFLNVHLNKKEKVHFGSLFAKLVKKNVEKVKLIQGHKLAFASNVLVENFKISFSEQLRLSCSIKCSILKFTEMFN